MRRFATMGVFLILLSSVSAMASENRPIKAVTGSIYIRSDGSIEGAACIESNDNTTYVLTANINQSVVVERSNIIVDGNGHMLNGSGLVGASGFHLSSVSNVTIGEVNVTGFASGVVLSQSQDITIVGNSIANSSIGVSIDSTSSDNAISRNRMSNVGTGVFSGMGASGNVVSGNTIEDEHYCGIRISGFNHTISGNNISAYNKHEDQVGIYLGDFINGIVSGNRIEDSRVGVWVGDWAENNNISGNTMLSNYYGMYLTNLALYNRIRGNTIEGAEVLSIICHASYNYIFQNNIIADETRAVQIIEGFSFWDDGYPSGGNHWSHLSVANADLRNGVHQNETGSDGMLDQPFMIQGNSIDHYPLAGQFNTFHADMCNQTECSFDVVSNSTVTNLNFTPTANPPALSFDVEGANDANGFCRVTIPKTVMWCDNPDQWIITAEGQMIQQRRIIEEGSSTYIYFTYVHTTKTIQIESIHAIPESSSLAIILLFVAATALTVVRRTKRIRLIL